MTRLFALMILAAGIFLTGSAVAQDFGQRSTELAAALDKTKYKKKEKRNTSVETYLEVRNVPAVRSDPAAYSGRYSQPGYQIDLKVTPDGTVEATGFDSIWGGPKREFTLKNGRINGALLTGVKVYEGGESQSFEALFVQRTTASGRNASDIDERTTLFGLGFVETGTGGPFGDKDGTWTNRIFLERGK